MIANDIKKIFKNGVIKIIPGPIPSCDDDPIIDDKNAADVWRGVERHFGSVVRFPYSRFTFHEVVKP